jgi:hypothetical protein
VVAAMVDTATMDIIDRLEKTVSDSEEDDRSCKVEEEIERA